MNLKDLFYTIKTPEELLDFMDKYIQYGWIGKDNIIRYSNIGNLLEKYRMASLDEIFEYSIGICFEQVALEKLFFDSQNLKNECYAIYNHHMCHAFLLYEYNHMYYKFEHASYQSKGIFEYQNKEELLIDEIKNFCDRHKIKSMKHLVLLQYDTIHANADSKEIKTMFDHQENLIHILDKK